MKYRQRKSRLLKDLEDHQGAAQLDNLRQRQIIFDALAKGLEAGMTPAASISAVPGANAELEVKQLINSLEKGNSITETIKKQQLGSRFDRSLISIGETSGRLVCALQFIVERYKRIIDRKRRLKSKLRIPQLVGFLAIIVIPLPDFVAGTIPPVSYFLGVTFSAIVLFSMWRLAKYFFLKYNHASDSYPSHGFMGIPVIEAVITDYSRAGFLERLHLLYASGYPIIDAVELSQESLVGFARRARYRELTQDLHQGHSLTDTFEHHDVLSETQLPILATGEAAGRLEETLSQIALESRANFDQQIDTFITWFPRIIYTLLVLAIASKIL